MPKKMKAAPHVDLGVKEFREEFLVDQPPEEANLSEPIEVLGELVHWAEETADVLDILQEAVADNNSPLQLKIRHRALSNISSFYSGQLTIATRETRLWFAPGFVAWDGNPSALVRGSDDGDE